MRATFTPPYTCGMPSPAQPFPIPPTADARHVTPAPAPSRNVKSLSGLVPFLRPYRLRIGLAILFLVMAAVSTLVFPVAMKSLIDEGFVAADPGTRLLAMREHFFALFAVGAQGVHEDGASLVTHFPPQTDLEAVYLALSEADESATVETATVPDIDWSEAWKSRIHAHDLGSLTVTPPSLTLWRRFWPVSLTMRRRSAAGLKSTPNEFPTSGTDSLLTNVAAALRVLIR